MSFGIVVTSFPLTLGMGSKQNKTTKRKGCVPWADVLMLPARHPPGLSLCTSYPRWLPRATTHHTSIGIPAAGDGAGGSVWEDGSLKCHKIGGRMGL